jgi:hypothetical protein
VEAPRSSHRPRQQRTRDWQAVDDCRTGWIVPANLRWLVTLSWSGKYRRRSLDLPRAGNSWRQSAQGGRPSVSFQQVPFEPRARVFWREPDLKDVQAAEQDAKDDEQNAREKASPEKRNDPGHEEDDTDYPQEWHDNGTMSHRCQEY